MAYNTGNPLGSSDFKDLSDNAVNFDKYSNGPDPTYPNRFGQLKLSISGMNEEFNNAQEGREAEFQQFLQDSAFIFIGDYTAGLEFTNRSQYTIRDGVPYRLAPSTTVPYTTTGNWALEVSNFTPMPLDDILRQDLAPADSEVLVGGVPAEDLGALAAAVTIGSDGRARATKFIAGTEDLVAPATRDAFVVGRSLVGLTDCHAFADRTIISGVTDAGTYGVFDATTRCQGSANQNHIYSFQHRVIFEGSGILGQFAGLLTRPVHAGTGVVNASFGADIGNISVTAGGTVTEQTGVRIRDLTAATVNVGIVIDQTAGAAYYAAGGGTLYNKGRAGFGISPNTTYAVQFAGTAVGARRGFLETTATNLQIGAERDTVVQIIANSAARLQIKAAANNYTVAPGADNAQTLGDAAARWSVVWAGTATISTSDAREKTEVRQLTTAEIAAASALAKEIGAFKFLSAVAEKGDAAREHIGMTVQRAIEVMEAHGLDPFGYSFICYDKWDETPEAPAGDRYSFRESGLYAFIAAGFEARLAALESKV